MNLPANVSQHLRGLRHVGVVTENLETTLARLQNLFGIEDAAIVRVPAAGEPAETRFAFLNIGGQPYELIEPVSPHFREILLGSNRGVNHVCYNVDNLNAAVAAMAAHGVRLGHVTPDGILNMAHARMAYFNPADTAGILIEFVEPLT